MKTKLLLPLLSGSLFATASSHAAVLAGWDTWTEVTSVSANVLATGFTATATTAVERVFTDRGSNDGSFGTLSGATSGDTTSLLSRNSDSGIITISITNNSGSDYTIDSLHVDYLRNSANASDTFKFTYVSGGSLGPDGTLIGSLSSIAVSAGANVSDYLDYDTNTSALTTNVLANGETATFTLDISDFSGGNSSLYFDNLAIVGTAVPVPESSAALLGGVGALMLLRRKRG